MSLPTSRICRYVDHPGICANQYIPPARNAHALWGLTTKITNFFFPLLECHERCRDHRQAWSPQLETTRLGKYIWVSRTLQIPPWSARILIIANPATCSTSNRPALPLVTVSTRVSNGWLPPCARQATSKESRARVLSPLPRSASRFGCTSAKFSIRTID